MKIEQKSLLAGRFHEPSICYDVAVFEKTTVKAFVIIQCFLFIVQGLYRVCNNFPDTPYSVLVCVQWLMQFTVHSSQVFATAKQRNAFYV